MDPAEPVLYLDPLFPLNVRRDPVRIPRIEDASARVVLICVAGFYRLTGPVLREVQAPGILRCNPAEGGCLKRSAAARGWLLVLGGRLLDQLVVAAFGDPGFSRFLDEIASGGKSACEPFRDDLARDLEGLVDEMEARRPSYRVRCRSLLSDILLCLYRATLVTPGLANGDGGRLASVLDFIEMNYADELSLTGLADMMGTSPTYFSRLFRSEVGMPLFEHINRTRIRKACVLLRRSELSITRIAFDVGYNSVSFFNRYFRRIMHVSPREYRRYLLH